MNGSIVDGGGNLVWSDTTCPGINADPKLSVLANNGGATQTMKLGQSSAAIDAAIPANCPATDQRGTSRTDLNCDIGAYEMQISDGNQVVKTPSTTTLTTFGPALVGIQDLGVTHPGIITATKVSNWTGGTPPQTIGAWWELSAPTTTNLNLTLKLCYLDSDNPTNITIESLWVWRYDGTSWGNGIAPSSTNRDSQGNNCVTVTGVTGLSRWALSANDAGPGSSPTAVTLSSFQAATPSFDVGRWLMRFLGR